MNPEINNSYIAVRGKALLLENVDPTLAYRLVCEGEFTKVTDDLKSGSDGSLDKIYTFEIARAEVHDSLGKITKTKDIRKASQKLRAILRVEWESSGEGKTEEEYYQIRMGEIMRAVIDQKI